MRILFLSPISFPHTGNSLPIATLMDFLRKNRSNEIDLINLSNKRLKSGLFNTERIFRILKICLEAKEKAKRKDLIYITVAQSFWGNIRDLFFYIFLFDKRNKTIIHMLGGAAMKNILDPSNGWQFKINRFFISKLGAVIVEGKPQAEFFNNVIKYDKILIRSNFAQDYLFSTDQAIESKFLNPEVIRILFLSNLIYGKGYYELLGAVKKLNESYKNKIKIDFAGNFDNMQEEEEFLRQISEYQYITYHGHVSGDKKKALFHDAHIFCLPTYYPYEGQPFAIIEAYASGCAVITTNQGGIGYIFEDKKNGLEVEKKSIESLKENLIYTINNMDEMKQYAKTNLLIAQTKYTEKDYVGRIAKLINDIYTNKKTLS